jgi:hypothetical protein
MGYGQTSSLKFFKTLKIHKNSTGTCSFNPETKEAWSYNWCFLKVVKGKLIFNDYSYSVTTSSHQSCVRSLLKELKIKVHAYVDQRECLTSGIQVEHVIYRLELAKYKLTRKGLTQKTRSNIERDVERAEKELKALRSIGVRVPRKLLKEVRERAKKDETERLESNRRYSSRPESLSEDLKKELVDLGPVDLLDTMDDVSNTESIEF